jgi:hypothetical protein
MGGRISGASPREENVAVWIGNARAERPYQTKGVDDTATPTVARQASKQQPAVCNPLGQHDLCEVSD